MKIGSKLKVLSLTICALMVVSAFSLTVSATPTLTVNTPTQTLVSGSIVQVTVPFTATDVAQVTLLAVKATVDTTTAPDATEANIAYIDQNDPTSGSFTFKVDTAALAGQTKLFIKVGGTSLDNPGETVIEVNGGSLILGDLNGDGKVDINDTLEHLKVVTGKPSTTLKSGVITDYDHLNGTDIVDTLIHLKVVVGKMTFPYAN